MQRAQLKIYQILADFAFPSVEPGGDIKEQIFRVRSQPIFLPNIEESETVA